MQQTEKLHMPEIDGFSQACLNYCIRQQKPTAAYRRRFLEEDGVERCMTIMQSVTREVQAMIRSGLEQETI
jgi:hypothetical protein